MWSGVRTGLGCIAVISSEKNWGWAVSLVGLRQLDQAGRGIWFPIVRGYFKHQPSEKHHLSESNWPVSSVQVGQPSQVRTHWCPFVDKMSREQGSLLWHHYDVMTGIYWILCKVLWILHLSRKTEAKNTVLLAGIYETTAWEIHIWGYVYICVSVHERERERGELLKYFGETGHTFD